MINLYDKFTFTFKNINLGKKNVSIHLQCKNVCKNWAFIILDMTDINQIGPTLREYGSWSV